MSLLWRAAWRVYDAMDRELRAWVIYEIGFGELRFTVTDECRLRIGPPLTDKNFWEPIPEFKVIHERFKTRAEAECFIQIECIKRGLIHLVCFWRKEPKIWL